MNELAWGNEERLLSHIENRIFDHLIRQSDVAVEYDEDDDEEDDNDETSDIENATEHSSTNKDDDDEDEYCLNDADPRAGRGDVTLPQIPVDYENVAKTLLEAGSKKEVRKNSNIVISQSTTHGPLPSFIFNGPLSS